MLDLRLPPLFQDVVVVAELDDDDDDDDDPCRTPLFFVTPPPPPPPPPRGPAVTALSAKLLLIEVLGVKESPLVSFLSVLVVTVVFKIHIGCLGGFPFCKTSRSRRQRRPRFAASCLLVAVLVALINDKSSGFTCGCNDESSSCFGEIVKFKDEDSDPFLLSRVPSSLVSHSFRGGRGWGNLIAVQSAMIAAAAWMLPCPLLLLL